jgi:Nuclease-related domain
MPGPSDTGLNSRSCTVDGTGMSDLVVRRWNRYGKDRLYVNTPSNERVGWVDLATGVETLERPELAEAFRVAIDGYRTCASTNPGQTATRAELPKGNGDGSPSGVNAGQPVESAPAPAREAEPDLTARRPGQAARERAEQEWKEMQDRSRVGAGLARLLDVKTDERAWRVGAKGEEAVGVRLERLRERGWHVLHAVPVGARGSDIDHVLIGPGGVFTVNTKRHPGKSVWVGRHVIKVDGYSQPYLRNSRFEADRASRLLTEALGRPVFARAVLVFATGFFGPSVTVRQQPDDVRILEASDVPRAFRRGAVTLTPDEVDDIFAAARRPETWLGR